MRLIGIFRAAMLSFAICAPLVSKAEVEIRMMAGPSYGIPPKESVSTTALIRRAVFEEFQRKSGVRVVNAGGLSLTGPMADNMFLMSMAGSNPPDIFYVNFRQYYTFVEQGFARPLDDLIAKDKEVLSRANPIVMDVVKSFDGKVYAIPFFQVALGLFYRKDHFKEAGLNPEQPPKNWDEFYSAAKKLTESAPGRKGYVMSGPGYHWSNFLYQAGGEVVKRSPSGVWESQLNSPQAAIALDFYRKMVNEKWKGKDGKEYGPAVVNTTDLASDIRTGKASMWFAYTNDVVMQSQADVPPSLIGIARMPAGPAGFANEINAGMWAINSQVKDPAKLKACWDFIKFFAGNDAAKITTDRTIELGLGNLVNPEWLERFGYDDILATVDQGYVQANKDLFKSGHPEPYGKNCQQVYIVMDQALDRARLEPKTPAQTILAATAIDMNEKLLGYTPPELLAKQRAWATGIFASLILFITVLVIGLVIRARKNREIFDERIAAGANRRRIYSFMALCLAPAVLSIFVWSYYPLAKGLQIAFQDFRLMGGAQWVGLDNFIAVFTQPIFYKSIVNSFVYVGLSIVIGFLIPIFLALILNEIPRGKVLFRTIFYLPAMTSPIIVAFLWRQFYDKSEQGLLNMMLKPWIDLVVNPFWTAFGNGPVPTANDWLGNPSLAMFAVVLPGVWAGAGPGSILYLAALKNIAEERYEAADLDGASWWNKIRYITLPGLKPLILINLLGVFIAGFKAMENVFVLTGGGPLNSTRTMGLEVWQNAFMFLRFGYATAAAWVMGAILIGFTLIQIRNLQRMRFGIAKL